MSDIVGIGSAVFDTLMTVDAFPEEDTKKQSRKLAVQCGGPCATAMVAASKLGIRAGYMGLLGDDMYGRFIRERLGHYGVDTKNVRMIPGTVSYSSVVICCLESSSRTCIWDRGTVPDCAEKDVSLSELRTAKILHLDGHNLDAAIYAAQKARESGVKVSLDAGGLYTGIEELLPLVDILIPSEEFALKFTCEKSAEKAAYELSEQFRPDILIITQGKKGGFIWKQEQAVRYPAYPVKAIDSNGAGDVFHGAFLTAIIKGMETEEAASFASAASALKCTRFGAQEGIPGYEETLEYMKSVYSRKM